VLGNSVAPLREANLDRKYVRVPHPGCFAQRVRICLKTREITFCAVQKSAEEYQKKGDRAIEEVASDE
jgi:hypothetical protein